MRCVIVVLYVLAAVLPIVGFARLLCRAQSVLSRTEELTRERGTTSAAITDFNVAHSDITVVPRKERNDLVWDIALVGAGLVFGAVASIWVLFLG